MNFLIFRDFSGISKDFTESKIDFYNLISIFHNILKKTSDVA